MPFIPIGGYISWQHRVERGRGYGPFQNPVYSRLAPAQTCQRSASVYRPLCLLQLVRPELF